MNLCFVLTMHADEISSSEMVFFYTDLIVSCHTCMMLILALTIVVLIVFMDDYDCTTIFLVINNN